MYQNNINNLVFIFVSKPFSQLKYITKIYQWFSWTRWLIGVVLPLLFFFSDNKIIIIIQLVLSVLTFVIALLTHKDRSGLGAIMILISECCAMLWILCSVFLVYKSSDDDFWFKLFVQLMHIFWVLNHIFELIVAVFCILPMKEINDYSTYQENKGRIRIQEKGKDATKKIKDVSTKKSIMKKTEKPDSPKNDEKVSTVDDFAFSVIQSENELNRMFSTHQNHVSGRVRQLIIDSATQQL